MYKNTQIKNSSHYVQFLFFLFQGPDKAWAITSNVSNEWL